MTDIPKIDTQIKDPALAAHRRLKALDDNLSDEAQRRLARRKRERAQKKKEKKDAQREKSPNSGSDGDVDIRV